MMRGLIVSWGVAEGIVCYRSIKGGGPPLPGMLLATSGAFVLLALLAEAAPELAVAIGVGIDIAAVFQSWPGSTGAASTSQAAAAGSLGASLAVAAAGA